MRRLWTTALAALVLAGGAATALAQDPEQEALRKKKEDKLAEAWVSNAPWVLDFDAAKAAAKDSGKPILAYFTRSYAP